MPEQHAANSGWPATSNFAEIMNPFNLTFVGQNSDHIPGGLIFAIIVGIIFWLWSVVIVATKKTDDPYDRIVWLLIILALNIVGTILYFIFGNQKADKYGSPSGSSSSEADIKRRANEGTLV